MESENVLAVEVYVMLTLMQEIKHLAFYKYVFYNFWVY